MRVSERWTVLVAAAIGFMVALLSASAGAAALFAVAHAPGHPWAVAVLAFLLPIAAALGAIGRLYRGADRRVVLGGAGAGLLLGYCFVVVQATVVVPRSMVTVEYANLTGVSVQVYAGVQGEELIQQYRLVPHGTVRSATGWQRRGAWLRVVAYATQDSATLAPVFPDFLSASDEVGLQTRKLFDRRFTWEELQEGDGRVNIGAGAGGTRLDTIVSMLALRHCSVRLASPAGVPSFPQKQRIIRVRAPTASASRGTGWVAAG